MLRQTLKAFKQVAITKNSSFIGSSSRKFVPLVYSQVTRSFYTDYGENPSISPALEHEFEVHDEAIEPSSRQATTDSTLR